VREFFDPPVDTFMQAAHEGIVLSSAAGTILALNPAALRMFACDAGQALGRALDTFLPSSERSGPRFLLERLAASGSARHVQAERRTVLARRFDGSEFPVKLVMSRVETTGTGAALDCLVAFVRDVSEQSELGGELQRLKDRLRAVFELAPVALWIAESDRIVFANRAAVRLFGAESATALLGCSIYSLLGPQSHAVLREQMAHVLAHDGDVASIPGRLVRADGEERDVDIALASLPDHGRTTVQMVVADVTQRKREAIEIERSRQALRRLSANAVEVREEERRKIARELHDELGQRLTALKIDLSSCALHNGLEVTHPRVAGMLQMIDDSILSLRRIAADLRPLMLDDLGLGAAIEWLAKDASGRLGIRIDLALEPLDCVVDGRVAIAAYRIVQEALTNVARHAQASEVRIQIQEQHEELEILVQDNGVGLPALPPQAEGRFGLLGIRERVEMLGGRFEVGNRIEGGAYLRVRLPLQQAPASAGEGPAQAMRRRDD
jgi:PAS domain S-box-containing protein